MPYISMTTSKTLTADQRAAVARELGTLITTIPGKTEDVLMIDIADGHDMFFAGERRDCIFMNVGLYTAAPYAAKAEFAGAVCEMLEDLLGVPVKDIYLNFSEFPNWCAGGALK